MESFNDGYGGYDADRNSRLNYPKLEYSGVNFLKDTTRIVDWLEMNSLERPDPNRWDFEPDSRYILHEGCQTTSNVLTSAGETV